MRGAQVSQLVEFKVFIRQGSMGKTLCYLLVLFCFHFREIAKETDLPPIDLEAVTFKSILLQALDSLHGKVQG